MRQNCCILYWRYGHWRTLVYWERSGHCSAQLLSQLDRRWRVVLLSCLSLRLQSCPRTRPFDEIMASFTTYTVNDETEFRSASASADASSSASSSRRSTDVSLVYYVTQALLLFRLQTSNDAHTTLDVTC